MYTVMLITPKVRYKYKVTTTKIIIIHISKVCLSSYKGDGKNLINARVLLDSASQRTFMTAKLAQQLNLFCECKEHLSVSTFGAEKTREVDTYVVNFQVGAKDGLMCLNKLLVVCKGIHCLRKIWNF